ncbi:hypothetical protein [Hymenobacter bucti]|uniref:Uncharacterized protein n=1 Tax=Hymenobacter bucti TaxID=1844114 RepID=A0ABW4R2J3_9BACT
MLKQFDLLLAGPGIVFFDPFLLDDFVRQKQVASPNLFPSFLDEPAISKAVAQAGLLLPIYDIPPLDYQIVLNTSERSVIRAEWVRFTTSPFSLTVGQQGRLVAADAYALMEWDATFYQELGCDGPLAPQVATAMMPGNYQVRIKGFAERDYRGRGPKNIGYELLLDSVAELTIRPEELDTPEVDFVLWRPGQVGA